MRKFETGATRDDDQNKYDYEGFISPFVLERFGEYMHKHRVQADGSLRDSDNWQKGIPLSAYVKSFIRHVFELWRVYRRTRSIDLDIACAVMFNLQGMMHEVLQERDARVPHNPVSQADGYDGQSIIDQINRL